MPVVVGLEWDAKNLRNKSFDDLHRLWYILLKEQNALLTESYHLKVVKKTLDAPHRVKMVKKSMARIKLVLTERAIAEAGDNEDQRKVMMRLINGPRGTGYVHTRYPNKEEVTRIKAEKEAEWQANKIKKTKTKKSPKKTMKSSS
eukprot:CAMPEP_0196571096 /NCGR_PEP_ID=MMETSP1081-20130531/1260_1 /TAXON_ID=36882 /ORGANISM="Pyramimonas amylifera, Strain CCMP720" /LENGTH=144 /DNA_ID=CAMNT_0041887871 /DNA_START=248 /DNA_END=682 /DNA_ORIENTATION=-